MGQPEALYQGKIFLSCTREKNYTRELVMNQHALSYIFAGTFTVYDGNETHLYHPGDLVIVPRNQLLRVTKIPAPHEPYRSVSIFFPHALLRKFYASHPVASLPLQVPKHLAIKRHPLLKGLFNSFLPYFELQDELPAGLAEIKIQETLTVLNDLNPQVQQILSAFQEPDKVDLAGFMEQNFMYNLPLEKFAYLTGRSLTTFKKDFKSVFNDSPGRWLTAKRLELAHYQLSIQKRKPTDVYLDAGFENLSHFSFAFKKKYGYSPANGI
jgi:AraC-like DNA-binding protein